MIRIPDTDKKFLQSNRSNITGNLWSTFNIDLQDNLGAIRIGQRLKIVTKTGDASATNMGVTTSFNAFGGKIVCFGGTRVFISSSLTPDMTFAEDASTNARTDWSADSDDLCNFNGTLCGINCTQQKVYSLSSSTSGTWTQRASFSDGGSNGQLLHFKKFNRLYLTNASNIHSIDTSWNISTSGTPFDLTLTGSDDGGNIQCFAAASDRIWIGMKKGLAAAVADNNNPNPSCSIYDWDGISNQVTKEYKIPALGVMAIIMRKDIPIVIDTEGVLREFDSQGFKEIGRLPIRRGQQLLVTASPAWTQNFIHPKGLALTKDNTILGLINNQPQSGVSEYENLPSGIWEFDTNGSASHKHSFTLMPMSSTSVTDHGQNKISAIGSLRYIRRDTSSAYGISTLIAGATYYTDASSTKSAVFMDAPWPTDSVTYPEGQKYGYFVSTWAFPADAKNIVTILAQWQKSFVKFRKFLDSGDKMILKYRLSHNTLQDITITWTSTTTFTTATDLTGKSGYEVEVLQGTGSGKCSHITNIVDNFNGTFTITVDETYTGASSQTAKARVQNWTKYGSYALQTAEYFEAALGKNSSKIQVKVCFQAMGDDEIEEFLLIDEPYRQAV